MKNRHQIIARLKKAGITFSPTATTEELRLLLPQWLTIRNAGDEGFSAGETYDFEMNIDGQIGVDYYGDEGYSAADFQNALKDVNAKGKRGLCCIHSGGGNVWDAFKIHELIKNHGNIDTKVMGIAASSGDVIFQAGKNRIMPRMAMRMGHAPSALFAVAGNATQLTAAKPEMDKTIDRLNKHTDTLANMYVARNSEGRTNDEVRADMDAEEFMDGDESMEKGYCDSLSDEMPVTNRLDLTHLKKVPAEILNQFSAPKQGENQPTPTNKTKVITVNREQKLALLRNEWGMTILDSITNAEIDALIAKGKPAAANPVRDAHVKILNGWNVPIPANASDDAILALITAGKPSAAAAINDETRAIIDELRTQAKTVRRASIRAALEVHASADGGSKIGVNEIDNWLTLAEKEKDDPQTGNPILAQLAKLDSRAPGLAPLNIDPGTENLSIDGMNKVVADLLAPLRDQHRNARGYDENQAKVIGLRSKQMNNLIKQHAKYVKTSEHPEGELTGPLRAAWDRWAAGGGAFHLGGNGSIQNANTMSADLLRQLILSEVMRAFKRKFMDLRIFSTKFENVPLEGNDFVKVPYYPLVTTASTEFNYANGYVTGASAVTSSKSILVGGIANNVATAGSGRKYQALQFSAYEIARQPWLDIAKLAALAAEQLAIDVRADILGTQINAANFGNKIWSGAAGAFDHLAMTQYLQNAAIKAFWPKGRGNVILTPDFYTSLTSDPQVSEFLKSGSTDTFRKGVLGGMYGFEGVDYDALLPVTTSIRGGDGAATVGTDLNLAGFMAFPSAIGIATAPIMPSPGVMRKLLTYELITEEESNLTLGYRYWGDEKNDVDNNIIEITYGSNVFEVQALKRIVTAGN